MAKRIELNYKWSRQMTGQSIDERNLAKIKYLFTYFSNVAETSLKSRVLPKVKNAIMNEETKSVTESKLVTPEAIFLSHLKNTADRDLKFNKFVDFYKHAEDILKFFKNVIQAKKDRKDFLRQIWARTIKDSTKAMTLTKAKAKKISKPMKKIISQLVNL